MTSPRGAARTASANQNQSPGEAAGSYRVYEIEDNAPVTIGFR